MKTKKILIIFILVIFVTIIFISKEVKAIDNGDIFLGSSYVIENDVKKDINRTLLSNLTNTIEFTNKDYDNNEFNYSRLNNEVDEIKGPMLTVLTHGYRSTAAVWSNNFEYFGVDEKWNNSLEFIYDSDSLIERLRK